MAQRANDEPIPGIDNFPTRTDRTARNNRALNRRVEIFLVPGIKKKKKRKPAKCLELDAQLKRIAKTTKNPTSRCLAQRLLDDSADHKYLPDSQLAAFMGPPVQDVGITGYTNFLIDMKVQLQKRLDRFNRVPTKESCQSRFRKSFERLKSDFIRGVKMLEFIECYDPRTPAVRRFILRQTKRHKSVYSCSVIAKQVEAIISRLGGTRGCGRGV